MKKCTGKLIAPVLAITMALGMLPSITVSAAGIAYPSSITLSVGNDTGVTGLNLFVGDTVTIVANLKYSPALPSGGNDNLVTDNATYDSTVQWTWDSNGREVFSDSNRTLAKYKSSITITATAPGTTNIYANTGNSIVGYKSATCAITVRTRCTVSFNANGGTGSMANQTFTSGISQVLTANAFTKSGYTFAGWATSAGGSAVYKDKQSITVNANITLYAVWDQIVLVTGVTLNKTTSMLAVGASETLMATVTPSNAANKAVNWSNSVMSAVSVDTNGKVTAYTTGTGTVTVKTQDGGYTASCTYTVFKPVTSVTLNKTSSSMGVGCSETLTATITPYDANYRSMSWVSNNSNVVTVDANGKVTAVGTGTTKVVSVVVQADGSGTITTLCSYTVTQAQLVTGITLNKNSGTLIVGGTDQLLATVSPSNAANKALTWESQAPGIATVDSTGKVTAIAAGQAPIIVRATDGSGYKAICYYTVLQQAPPATNVTLSKTSSSLKVGASETLTAILTPSYATYAELRWLSGNTEVLTVDANGKVTAVGTGTAPAVLLMFSESMSAPKTVTCLYTVTQ